MSERKVFTYKDVEEVKKYIGKRGMFSDNFKEISEGMGYSGDLDNPFKKDCVGAWCPFFCISGSDGGGIGYQFFSPDPEPVEKWVPFTAEDFPLLLGKGLIRKRDKTGAMVGCFGEELWLTCYDPEHSTTSKTLLEDWEFIDGTPCGKRVTE